MKTTTMPHPLIALYDGKDEWMVAQRMNELSNEAKHLKQKGEFR